MSYCLQDIKAKKLYIEEAEIKKKNSLEEAGFPIIILAFFIGALSFAVALSYNSFVDSIFQKLSFGTNIFARLTNFILSTSITILLIYVAWKTYPSIVGSIV